MSSSPLLKVEDLQIRARLGTRERTIVTAMELSVTAGETIGIVGESGSGKSMTARALIGLLRGENFGKMLVRVTSK